MFLATNVGNYNLSIIFAFKLKIYPQHHEQNVFLTLLFVSLPVHDVSKHRAQFRYYTVSMESSALTHLKLSRPV